MKSNPNNLQQLLQQLLSGQVPMAESTENQTHEQIEKMIQEFNDYFESGSVPKSSITPPEQHIPTEQEILAEIFGNDIPDNVRLVTGADYKQSLDSQSPEQPELTQQPESPEKEVEFVEPTVYGENFVKPACNAFIHEPDDSDTKTAIIEVNLAGYPKDGISITVDNNEVTVIASRKEDKLDRKCKASISEIDFNDAKRVIKVSSNYADGELSSTFFNGLLTIQMKALPIVDTKKTIKIL